MTVTEEQEIVGETIGGVVAGIIEQEWANILACSGISGTATVTFTVTLVTAGFRQPHKVAFKIKPPKPIGYTIPVRNGESYREVTGEDNHDEVPAEEGGDPEGMP